MKHDYAARYRRAHRASRQWAIETVRVSASHGVCPFCWRVVPIDLYTSAWRGKERKRHRNHLELHHLSDYDKSRVSWLNGVPACRECHITKLHAPHLWCQDPDRPDRNHTVSWFSGWARVRWAIVALPLMGLRLIASFF